MSGESKSVTLYHHPFTRAAGVLAMLEELQLPYTLRFVDLKAGEQRASSFRALNPMGKLPTLVDGDIVVTEAAAIGLYLADRYGYGTLAPAMDDPARGTYLRWSLFAPSVIEPAAYAKGASWEYRAESAGWGEYESMLDSVEHAIGEGPWLLGERFSMADVIFGGTVRYLLHFKMLEPRPRIVDYVGRLSERPALRAAQAKNEALAKEHGLAVG
ncbi:MAG: glutathione S-transferase family protein [Proteobacteria bacterium]|nr:glutathione S-transferase family protein [Pseudomonadota bacterium]